MKTFRCQRCGNCCRQPGEVRVSDGECAAIAATLGLSIAAFMEQFTRLREDRRGLALTEQPDGACIFLEGDPALCRIQPVKPQQCRDFPFTWRYEDLEQVCTASRDVGASTAHPRPSDRSQRAGRRQRAFSFRTAAVPL